MKISREHVNFRTIKITDDYPPGVDPFISYGIHRTLTDSLFSINAKKKKLDYDLCVLIDMILIESSYWRINFPMKGGLIDTEKCKPDSPYYHFVDFIQQIRKCIDGRHSSARSRNSHHTFGWDTKGGVELTNYDIRFLKDITTMPGRENRNSIYGFSKDITIEYLKYIRHMLTLNKTLVIAKHYMYRYDIKITRKYIWRCNDYLKKKGIMELYNLYRLKSPHNLFTFNYFNNTSITISHFEKQYFSRFAKTLNRIWFSPKYPHLDRLFLAKYRLNFTKNEYLNYDINEMIIKEFEKIIEQI